MLHETFRWESQRAALRHSLLQVLRSYRVFCYLDSNDFYEDAPLNTDPQYHTYDILAGAGATDQVYSQAGSSFEKLKTWLTRHQNWCFGHFGYDLKNELEALSSDNEDHQHLDDLHFFIPEWVVSLQGNTLTIYSEDKEVIQAIFTTLVNFADRSVASQGIQSVHLANKLDSNNYIERTQALIQHIIEGNIYEVNFCQEFYAEQTDIDPFTLFTELMRVSPTPFACLYRYDDHYVISASMERFLKKRRQQLISQPIKGTIKRGETQEADAQLIRQLSNDPKERAENVMIVDLVRNDLAKSAQTGSVVVDELCGIYSFPTVHQMISTVSAKLDDDIHPIDAIKHAFPMGSMTGAPKVSAMQLIEEYEDFKRGLFSGAVGYITPQGDYDFNVIIRSFLYNAENGYLSIPVGSAITFDADPGQEFEECLLKIAKLTQAIQRNNAQEY